MISALAGAQQPPSAPFVVRIVEKSDPAGLGQLAGILLGSLGLTGALVVLAALLGLTMAGLLYWIRSRQS